MPDKPNVSAPSILYISHGGGPLPLLGEPSHKEMIAGLQKIVTLVDRPSAIILISAHWETYQATITSGANPALLYDYSGFPQESYEIQYPVPGKPALARKICNILNKYGIEADLTEERGFDHGVFVPLKIMYPAADIPCVQLSLINNLDPAKHIQIGKALAGLQEEKILIIGSGFSFHNLKAFFSPSTEATDSKNESFEQWLIETCCSHALNENEREQRLIHWESAPAARFCHPREEHLLPLHVCYGVAQSPARRVFLWEILGKQVSAYLW
ncbi:MAG: dioxygenase [Proteobacteria bacterium]|jgi:aromatic ring-opening dioxygenase catalytic subunit (LigB family)|nr:dioxygenase [Pseudomonadota bacterium]MBU4326880.1 dioxygenase [Pseudomonadota bacterium]